MKILGISAFYHDSAAALICNNEIVAAMQEERFTRVKHDASFPANSVEYCLQYAGLTLNELDAIVFYDKPFLKFERLLETYYSNAPKGFISFIKAMPVWVKEKIFLRKLINGELKKINEDFIPAKANLLFTEHHLSHAASAFYASPFKESAILTIDGVGEWATASICIGKENAITVIKELHFPDSVGLLYTSFTYFLGFKVNSGEYKLMGLAPYGNINNIQTKGFIELIERELVEIYDNGSIKMNQKYFNYSTGLTMIHTILWEKLFGIPLKKPDEAITQTHCNLALAIQTVTEKIVLLMAKHTKEITGLDNLCLAGGVALNCVANGKIQDNAIFKDIFIQPAAGDAGGALGAALAANYIYFKNERTTIFSGTDMMKGASLGPEYSELDIMQTVRKYNACFKQYGDENERNSIIVNYLQQGKVIGLFSGRMEFGPRALGNRSIIASALIPEMQKTINLKIKFREGFRPFAAIVNEEDVNTYFDYSGISPYMLLVHKVNKDYCNALPERYEDLSMEEKLNVKKSLFPAITHVDLSCRIQTVSKRDNQSLWELLNCFKSASGYGMLINTSFNIRGEPIVCTPGEAYAGFMRTGMDVLVMNDFIFAKEEQPEWKETENIDKYLKGD
jgi:carbamoyltransferase